MVQNWALNPRMRDNRTDGEDSFSRVRCGRRQNDWNWKAARTLFFALALLILFSGFAVMRTFASGDRMEAESPAEIVVYADSGDTLWELAAAYKKDSLDIRQAFHALMERNHLKSPDLEAGQKIIVPSSILP